MLLISLLISPKLEIFQLFFTFVEIIREPLYFFKPYPNNNWNVNSPQMTNVEARKTLGTAEAQNSGPKLISDTDFSTLAANETLKRQNCYKNISDKCGRHMWMRFSGPALTTPTTIQKSEMKWEFWHFWQAIW